MCTGYGEDGADVVEGEEGVVSPEGHVQGLRRVHAQGEQQAAGGRGGAAPQQVSPQHSRLLQRRHSLQCTGGFVNIFNCLLFCSLEQICTRLTQSPVMAALILAMKVAAHLPRLSRQLVTAGGRSAGSSSEASSCRSGPAPRQHQYTAARGSDTRAGVGASTGSEWLW